MTTGGAGDIVRLAARGDGLTADGRHIAGAIPGDRLLADGAILPGAGRAVPACRHFGHCGGCQLQHANDAVLADFYRARILDPLERLGIVPQTLMPLHLSPPASRRRVSLRATRRDGQVVLGFSPEGGQALIDIGECPVLHPRLFALVGPLRTLLARHLPAKGAAGLSLTLTDEGPDLLISNLAADRLPVLESLAAFAATHDLARLSVEGPLGVETVALRADPIVRFGGVAVCLPPAAFLQATADAEAALVAAVSAITAGSARIADLFAGAGTFALPLSAGARVHAVDGAGPAIGALARAANAAGRPLTTEHRDLFRRPLLPDELNRFDAIVIDPPRAGAALQTEAIAGSRVRRVAAVSCNPATFARDAHRLVDAGFRIGRLWPVAQFRWSTHVELVAEFSRG